MLLCSLEPMRRSTARCGGFFEGAEDLIIVVGYCGLVMAIIYIYIIIIIYIYVRILYTDIVHTISYNM